MVGTFLIVPELFLIMGLITFFDDDVAIKLEVEDHLFDHIIGLEQSIFVREFGQIVRCLRIVRVEGFYDLFLFLFLGQLFLVDASQLVVLVHV